MNTPRPDLTLEEFIRRDDAYRDWLAEQTSDLRQMIKARPCCHHCLLQTTRKPGWLITPTQAGAVDTPEIWGVWAKLWGSIYLLVLQSGEDWYWVLRVPTTTLYPRGVFSEDFKPSELPSFLRQPCVHREFVSEPHASLRELQAALMGELRSLEARLQQHPEWD